ncbi:polysaccharide biosynthesis tyrosine autokinase [Candidatus Desantisbacteria bacterium]|nr:polysaccharide biosynthesis tyrosine autokinase [Candidatus Desantisbacteria bacterium]
MDRILKENTKKGTMNFRYYWRMLARRKWYFIIPLVLIPLIVTIGSFFLTPVYRASTILLVENKLNPGLMIGGGGDVINKILGQKIERLILSRESLGEVVDKLGLAEQPQGLVYKEESGATKRDAIISFLQKNGVQVAFYGEGVFEIGTFISDPELAMKLANTVAEVFIKKNSYSRRGEADETTKFVSEQLEDYRIKLEKSEEALQKYQQVNPEGKKQIISSKLANLDAMKVETDLVLLQAKSKLAYLKSNAKDNKVVVKSDPQLIDGLKRRKLDLEMYLSNLLSRYTEEYAEVIRAKSEIKKINDELALKLQEPAGSSSDNIDSAKEIYELETGIRGLEDKKVSLEKLTVQYSNEIKDLPKEEFEYLRLAREREANASIYQMLLKNVEEASIIQASEYKEMRNTFVVIDPAVKPAEPIFPNRMFIIIGGILGGLLFGGSAVMVFEYFDHSIKTLTEAKEYLGLSILGTIPNVLSFTEGGKNEIIAKYFDVNSFVTTEFRRLQKNIMKLRPHDSQIKTFSITSALSGEGKTFVTSYLAATFAFTSPDKKIIVIDFDLRMPRIHENFGVKQKEGLSEILQKKISLDNAIVNTSISNLFLLTGGLSIDKPFELLNSPEMKLLFEELRNKFDIIIIDSPAIIPVGDIEIFSSQIDGSILLFRAGKTPKEIILRSKFLLSEAGVHLLGTIINNAEDVLPYHFSSDYYKGKYYSKAK